MKIRTAVLATALLAVQACAALAQHSDDALVAPVLRASITVSGELVRIGDVIDNAGTAAQIAIYRAPDLGTTATLPRRCACASLAPRSKRSRPPCWCATSNATR